MPVGDVNSTERGSGARYNDGKDPMEQIPVRYWINAWQDADLLRPEMELENMILKALEQFQERFGMMDRIWYESGCVELIDDAMDVFKYGAEKYALYNWTKGMAWSIPIGCILRHMRAHLNGEELDPESGLPHLGHVSCNVMMLDWFCDHYPEGDDRPTVKPEEPVRRRKPGGGMMADALNVFSVDPLEPRAIIGHRVNV